MTSITEYLQAERYDVTEPASFYIPGADDWSNEISTPQRRWSTRRERAAKLYLTPEYEYAELN